MKKILIVGVVVVSVALALRLCLLYWQKQSNVSSSVVATNTEVKFTDVAHGVSNQSFDLNDADHLFLKNASWSVATSNSLGIRAAIWQTEKDTSFSRDVNFSGKEYFMKEREIKEGDLSVFVDEKTLASHGWVDGMGTDVNYKNYHLVFAIDEAPYSGTRRYFRIKDDKIQIYSYKWDTNYEYVPCTDGICDVVAGSRKETSRIFISDPVALTDIAPAITGM